VCLVLVRLSSLRPPMNNSICTGERRCSIISYARCIDEAGEDDRVWSRGCFFGCNCFFNGCIRVPRISLLFLPEPDLGYFGVVLDDSRRGSRVYVVTWLCYIMILEI
jgi:hypothetical protein